ncbi:hypothetical protein [Pseudoalteromonas sp. McH1-42]|uniref:hypothetical protein n=1 Tax=Pseudoalteromonas sp. McH1-42 TaxID=2917752 RepID=UPI001EF3DBAD|nr:hypothetical protein [Pseudoalteromonas sp. McH1-42]MCG7564613.1 hypothetical protein [Pseudoalteromonas sp. McH1-42]
MLKFIVLISAILLTIGCDIPREGMSESTYSYTRIDGELVELDFEQMIYIEGSSISPIGKCKIEGFKLCITVSSSVLAVPEDRMLPNGVLEKYSTGFAEELNVEYEIKRSKLTMGGNSFDGYFITIGSEPSLELNDDYSGSYFYSVDSGIIAFELYNYSAKNIKAGDDRMYLSSVTLWASKGIK